MKWGVARFLLFAVVAVVFAYAGIVKVIMPDQFQSSLLTYELFTSQQAGLIAVFAPVLEIVVALCLVTGFWQRGASLLTAVMLVGFIGLVAQARVRGLAIDCGCFGSNRLENDFEYAWKIGQNALLLAALGIALTLGSKAKGESVAKEIIDA